MADETSRREPYPPSRILLTGWLTDTMGKVELEQAAAAAWADDPWVMASTFKRVQEVARAA